MKAVINKPVLTPKLRFPEFRDAPGWDTKPGDKLFDQISNREAPAGIPILAITQEHGAIPRDDIDYHVSVTDKSIETYKEVRPGDFIISLRSFQGGIEHSKYHGICSPAYVILRKKTELSEAFFKHLFKSHNFIQQLTKNLEGLRDGKMISYKQFSELLLPSPIPAEQQKIAECLASLDELITAENRKLDAIKARKKGLMQQLFPREGETTPRFRFPEFRNAPEWEDGTLTELFDFQDGFSFKSTDFTSDPDDSTQVIRITDINNKNKNLDKTYVPNVFLKSINLKKHYAERGDLLLSLTGAAGFNFFTWDSTPALLNQRTTKITPKDEVNIALIHLLESLIHEKINARGEGQNNNLSREFCSTVLLRLPKPEEQHRIGTALSSFDDLIAAQYDRLSALRTHKQGLIQQLFPNQQTSQ